jgi:dTDP-4-dehydrorhamnose reductase
MLTQENNNMKILITGATGQVGSEILKSYSNSSHIVRGASRRDLDITNEYAVNTYIDEFCPDVIFHCAAYTSVDKAEAEQNVCYNVNVHGTKHLVHASIKHNIKFLYLSSDYVFDGTLDRPYEVDDKTHPINTYGKSKMEGELIVEGYLNSYFIVRTSWVFGYGKNFVNSILEKAKNHSEIKVVNDQVSSPTSAIDLAKLLTSIIETDKYGIYHVTNEGFCSWYDFAYAIFKIKGINMKIIPIMSEERQFLANRPKNSRLSKRQLSNAGFTGLPTWYNAISLFLKQTDCS